MARARGWPLRIGRRIGRRGAFLLFVGFVDFVYAWSLGAPTQEARANVTFQYLEVLAPIWVWALLWGGTGVLCFIGAFLRADRWAYAAAMFLKVLFGLTLASAQLIAHIPRAYVGAAVWLVFAGLTYLISTWPEAWSDPPLRSASDDELTWLRQALARRIAATDTIGADIGADQETEPDR